MKRALLSAALATLTLFAGSAHAQPAEPAPASAEPASTEPRERVAPTPEDWRVGYEAAREQLLVGEFEDAAARFASLESTAANRTDREVARAQRTLAEAWAERKLAFIPRARLSDPNLTAQAVDRRTTDELAVLYTAAVGYGVGSGLWLAQVTKPKTAAGGLLPMLGLVGASVGTVALLDSGRGLRYGVAQAIATGLDVGLESGIVWAIFAENTTRAGIKAETAANVVWGLSTAGAIGGGVLGAALGTTPGRSSWVGSTALWTGTLAGLFTGALTEARNEPTAPFATAGVGLAAGTGLGLATASAVSPSISRVRFLDLGGLGGGTVGLLLGLAITDEYGSADGRRVAGMTGLGAAVGLGTLWWVTSGMAPDRPNRETEEASKTAFARNVRPAFTPVDRGATFGLAGTLL